MSLQLRRVFPRFANLPQKIHFISRQIRLKPIFSLNSVRLAAKRRAIAFTLRNCFLQPCEPLACKTACILAQCKQGTALNGLVLWIAHEKD
ncbi:MAG TPA: hypothetical protein VN042_08895, partial [Asticcacaulis sp.]|nr:hypothetical protein [Asticcacaulis sp.]